GFMIRLDRLEAAEADADNTSDARRLFGIDLEAAVLRRHVGGGDAVLDKEIHFLDLFRLDEVLGTKIRHLAGDTAGKEFGVLEPADWPDAGAAGRDRLPVLLQARAERAYDAQTGDDDPSRFCFPHNPFL